MLGTRRTPRRESYDDYRVNVSRVLKREMKGVKSRGETRPGERAKLVGYGLSRNSLPLFVFLSVPPFPQLSYAHSHPSIQ